MKALEANVRANTLFQLILSGAGSAEQTVYFEKNFNWNIPSEDSKIWLSLPAWSYHCNKYDSIVRFFPFWGYLSDFIKEVEDTLRGIGYTTKLLINPHILIKAIVEEHDNIKQFWSKAHGWAPDEAAELLAKSRLDWLLSLSHCLHLWLPATSEDHDGRLILAWANLGALVEGSLKFFLCVYLNDYRRNPVTKNQRLGPLDPDSLQLQDLKIFYEKHVWPEKSSWNAWIEKIIQRRNSMHAFKTKEVDDFYEFNVKLNEYLEFIADLFGRLPYPDL